MKKTIGIMVFTLLIIAGCNQIGAIFEPIIGTWETTILGVTVSETYDADGTYTETNTLGVVGTTRTGTWTSSSTVLTKTWADDSSDEYSYSFNSDKSEMTLAPLPSGISITYSRQ